ncbi:MAG: phenylalanine--tRNA ligase subunit beta [Patescibacteria group bacterium]
MQIKILDSWLREYLKTEAKPAEIAKILSLTSVSVEKLEKLSDDFLYNIEVTTNRVDLMSVIGLTREASASLSESGFKAEFKKPKFETIQNANKFPIEIRNDPELVNRVCAAVLEVSVKPTPDMIAKRLEASGIRSLNNLIDVTNYVMRETGHPAHVFDYDLLNTAKLTVRPSRKNERILTLDNKEYSLLGEDIVMEDDSGRIVDLLGIMGLANSVVGDKTKKILFFIDNNEPKHIRNTSMSLGIRTEAAVLNEKGVDPDLALDALFRGIELYQEIADGKLSSDVLDIYPNRIPDQKIILTTEKVNSIIGEKVPSERIEKILEKLNFEVNRKEDKFEVTVPSFRRNDVTIEEDLIEEIARIYGYQNIKSLLPPQTVSEKFTRFEDEFYWEDRVKSAMKYFGFTEVYTYSLVSEDLYEGPIDNALSLKNPLSSDMKYLRGGLIPSLISILEENKKRSKVKIFEIANVYKKRAGDLPKETLTFAALVRNEGSFFELKGLIEAIFEDLGIVNASFKKRSDGAGGANIFVKGKNLGYIEPLSEEITDFEINFDELKKFATRKKSYRPIAKFPESSEDLAVVLEPNISTMDVLEEIKKVDPLISDVSLLDRYGDSRTFHIVYQSLERNLTKEDVSKIREEIKKRLTDKFSASFK